MFTCAAQIPRVITGGTFDGAGPGAGRVKLRGIVLHDSGLAFHSATGVTFRLVGSAFSLARLMEKGAQPADLLDHLLATYEVDEPTARRDLDSFLATLREMRWTEAA